MTRTPSQTRSIKQLKAKTKTPKKKKTAEIKTTKKNKDGWEMSAREALQVNFVVSET
jgi:hypothetical protein